MIFDKIAWLKHGLRRLSYKWPARYKTKVKARVSRGKYECSQCKEIVGQKEIQIDHIDPVIGVEGWVDWNTYIERLFVEESQLQAICKKCHTEKSNAENSVRREAKKKKLDKKD
jgi:5-methylcytosine-specific restriction endonuclease McrA